MIAWERSTKRWGCEIMKLYAKILPKYLKQIQEGKKDSDYRQFESIVFENAETGEKVEHTILAVDYCTRPEAVKEKYPDVKWRLGMDIYEIVLGRRL